MKTTIPSPDILQFIKKEFEYDHATGELFRKPFTWTSGKGSIRHYPRTLLNNNKVDSEGYIVISMAINGKLKLYKLHQIVFFLCMNSWPTDQIDHINGKKLDNNISNLRSANNSQNKMNVKKLSHYKGKTPSSKFKGVCWHKVKRKWVARITKDGQKIQLGYFFSEIDAANAYDKAAIKYFGDFKYLNFPMTLLLLHLSELSITLNNHIVKTTGGTAPL